MDTALQVCMVFCLVGLSSSQLFPSFSSLHQYALKEVGSPERTPGESLQHVKIETNERPSRHAGSDPEPHTVLVTPRPKYTPQNFVQEPLVGPNNSSVPALMDEKAIQERINPRNRDSAEEKKKILYPVTKPQRPATVVDTVPSLSVVIPAALSKNSDGPPDYLRPPRYPSIYNKPIHTIGDFNTTPLRDFPKTGKDSPKYNPHKEWHRKPDIKHNLKRKIRGKTTEPNVQFESQIQWGPPSGSLDTFTHKIPSYHLDPFYEHYIEQVLQEPQEQFTTLHERKISSGFSSEPPGRDLDKDDDRDSARVDYQTRGHRGPESYEFGYDVGKGKDRMFRFEEKDDEGKIKGQYGYYDKRGRLKIVTYEADHNGFRSLST